MREAVLKLIRGTPLEAMAFEIDERMWQWRGIRRGSFSQHGEDRIILDYFGGRQGVYVDVGANYPVKISNTYLLYRHGWQGLTIEPIPRLSRRHRRFRPRDIHLNAAISSNPGEMTFYEMETSGLSTFDQKLMQQEVSSGHRLRRTYAVPVKPLSQIILEHLGNRAVDLLSVDTEGYDLHVLQSVDWSVFRPKLIIYEVGDGAPEVDAFVQSQGYRTYRQMGCNTIVERID